MSGKNWTMPRPSIGDTVLFSTDCSGFSDPVVGFIVKSPGESTVSVLTFGKTGHATVYNSCHHKDDPALLGDHGWQDLGAWDFAECTKTIRDLTTEEPASGRKSAK